MKRIDSIRGNIGNDPDLADRIQRHERAGTLERVVLDASERKKSRLRVETDAGTDLGILVDQPELHVGDVVLLEDTRAVVVAFRSREAFVVELPEPTGETLAVAVELGHRIGNQHWDIAVSNGELYVPVEADRHIIESVIGEYVPPGATTRYEEVDAELFFDENDSPSNDKHDHTHNGGRRASDPNSHTHD